VNKRILVVDDEEPVRFLLAEELREEGYEVDEASSGEEAVKKVGNTKYDLVSLDIEMPGMNGLEAATKIREISPKTKVILATAYSHYKQELLSWAADAYIVKSSDLSEYKKVVKELLGR
jgi:CheY-like chemotaxis protein